MKKIIHICLALIVLSSCATQSRLNCAGQCSLQNMVCTGMLSKTSGTTGINYATMNTAQVTTNSEIVQCRPPKNANEREKVAIMKANVIEFNEKESSSYTLKLIGTFVGTLFLGALLL